MGRLIRVKINWSGWQGAPGYTNLHFEPTVEDDPITQPIVDAAVAKVQTWLAGMRVYLPIPVVTQIDSQVAELDEQTGDIVAWWTATVAAAAPGTGSTTFSAPSGLCINWSTAGVRNGRRVRGRTFVVPSAASVFANDGTLEATSLADMRTKAAALTGSSNGVRLGVYSRTPGALIPDGGIYMVTGSSIADKVAVLTSRRQ